MKDSIKKFLKRSKDDEGFEERFVVREKFKLEGDETELTYVHTVFERCWHQFTEVQYKRHGEWGMLPFSFECMVGFDDADCPDVCRFKSIHNMNVENGKMTNREAVNCPDGDFQFRIMNRFEFETIEDLRKLFLRRAVENGDQS